MFNKNDKTLYLLKKIVNVTLFIIMCLCVICGIIIMASSFPVAYSKSGYRYVSFNAIAFFIGLVTLVGGPIFTQLVYLLLDVAFNFCLDVKIIRNAQFGLEVPSMPNPLFHKNCNNQKEITGFKMYETLKQYKTLVDQEIITEVEFEELKAKILNKNHHEANSLNININKVKKLKTFADEKIITEEEFASEKAKILKNN